MSTVINGSTGIDKVQDGIVTDGKLNLTANSQEVKDALNAGGDAPIYACRAWVNFNGTGTVAIRGSGNVSSITDGGTGIYTINIDVDLQDANYAVVGGIPKQNQTALFLFTEAAQTAGAVQIRTENLAGSAVDQDRVHLAIFR